MIVVDTSALMAIVLAEPQAAACAKAIAADDQVLIAAPTVTECEVVAMRRRVEPEMGRLLNEIGLIVVPLTADRSRAAADAYRHWGKGQHRAKLNICDSFAYALAMEIGCPLLFVGNDFAQKDVAQALI